MTAPEPQEKDADGRTGGVGRVVFDLTSSARWSGAPVGIVRAERELARWAREHIPNLTFVVFDPGSMAYRAIAPRFEAAFLEGTATLDAWARPDPTGLRKRRSAWVPAPLYALLQARRTSLRLLERLRLTTRRPGLARAADWMQRRLMNARYRRAMIDARGERRGFVTFDMALREPIEPGPSDLLFCAGFGWNNTNISQIVRAKRARGFALAIVCYDLIPLLFPQFFKPRDVEDMRHYWGEGLAAADVVVTNAHAVAADIRAHCASQDVDGPRIEVRPLGADPVAMRGPSDLALPAGLRPDRYALFVSTIEPRKGHEMLYGVWRRLQADRLAGAEDFKLVFVGRAGWMMEGFEQRLRDENWADGSVVALSGVSDALLDQLYRRAAFCLYPSIYEGYGLPVVEAFARGKAVLTSNGGALAETAKGLSPCLDPLDEEAWRNMLELWITDPSVRASYEDAIRRDFRQLSWAEAAAGVFAAIGVAPSPPA